VHQLVGSASIAERVWYSHYVNGGWILGNTIDGTQAEYVRIPYADTSLYRAADDVDEEALVMLSDILPTGFECGVLNGKDTAGRNRCNVGADRSDSRLSLRHSSFRRLTS
jgi:alcohol dehydrogenase